MSLGLQVFTAYSMVYVGDLGNLVFKHRRILKRMKDFFLNVYFGEMLDQIKLTQNSK